MQSSTRHSNSPARAENQRVLAAMLTVGAFAAAARSVAIGKEVMVARWFGTAAELDAFCVAVMIPLALQNVLAGSVNVAFMPVYLEIRQRLGRGAAKRLLSSVSALASAAMLMLVIVLGLARRPLLFVAAPGFSAANRVLASRLLILLSGTLAIDGLASLWQTVLNAEGDFALPSLSLASVPAAVICAIVLLGARLGAGALALGTLAGSALRLVVLGCGLRVRGLPLLPRWYGMDKDVRRVLSQYFLGIAGSLFHSFAPLVDQSMASMLPAGSVAVLNYGGRLVGVANNLGATTLSTAILPSFSRLAAKREWSEFRALLRHHVVLALALTVPLTAMLIACSSLLVNLLYRRGAFSLADAALVTNVQIAFALNIPVYIVGIVVVRALSALQKNSVRAAGGTLNLLCDVLFNYLFMRWFGIVGIALSTSMMYLVSLTYLSAMLYRELQVREISTDLAIIAGRKSLVAN